MKICPNCKELVGDNVSRCFNCGWNFDDPSENERAIEREKKRKAEEEERRKREEEQRIISEEIRKKELEDAKREEERRRQYILKINDSYEYKIERVTDNSDGTSDIDQIKHIIERYSNKGWRLHTIYSNEIGKESLVAGIGGFKGGTNATINETIIVLERLIRPAVRY